MMRLRRLAIFALAAAALAQVAPSDKHHVPNSREGESRRKASALTEGMFPSETGKAAAIARKNFIDEFIFSKMERDKIPHAPLSGDEEFFRRLHIDFTGRIPAEEALRKFLDDPRPDKRARLIDELMSTPAFKAKWTYWFMDLSKTAANRVGPGGKNVYYNWVYDNFHLNRPYDEMVQDLLTANAVSNWNVGPASYVARWVVIGLACDDEVHEDTADELAINSLRHFWGINLTCVSCHDGANHLEKINVWLSERKREELYKVAAFFGGTRVLRRTEVAVTRDEYSIDDKGEGYDASARTVVRVPRKGKGKVTPEFLMTGAKPDLSRPLRPQYAEMLTSHPQFARAAVNLFWSEFFGVGIVEPVFDFDLARQDPAKTPKGWDPQPTHPELLDALAEDFRKSGYDLQHLFRTIAHSSTYQLSSRFRGEWKEPYAKYFARKFVRRLQAEEIHDSILQATGVRTGIPIRGTDSVVQFATETRSPEDFKNRAVPALKDANFFLESFGQTNREYSERTNDGDITQAILLMNSPFVMRQTKAAGGHLRRLQSDDTLSTDEKIRTLFRRFLVRQPSLEELANARDVVASSKTGWEDLQWLLVNKVEFLFNY